MVQYPHEWREYEPIQSAGGWGWRARLRKLWAPLAAIGAFLAKFGVVLLKFKFLFSIFVSAAFYVWLGGWWFGIGLIVLLFVHEMGHVVEAKRQGLPVSVPVFIPFMGALITLKQMPHNAWREARALSDVTAFQIWLQMAHRFLAAIIAVAVIAFCFQVWKHASQITSLKRLSIWWLVLLFCQLTLGAWTIWSNKAADVATAHVAMGALMLSFGVSICAIILRLQSTWHGLPPRGHLIDMGKMPMPRA